MVGSLHINATMYMNNVVMSLGMNATVYMNNVLYNLTILWATAQYYAAAAIKKSIFI